MINSKFVKEEGSSTKDILTIVEEILQEEFEHSLWYGGHINGEFDKDYTNDSAYIVVNGKNCVNFTFAVGTKELRNVLPAGRMMIEDYASKVPPENIVSFRRKITVEKDTDVSEVRYKVSFRACVVDK